MEAKNLYLNENIVGKYIEIDLNKYDLKLINSLPKKTVEQFVKDNNAIAGINGGLFNGDSVEGKLKDSLGNIKGQGSDKVPYILFKNNILSMDWNLTDNELKKYDFARTSAFYSFLLNGNYGEHTLIPSISDGINNSRIRSMIGQKTNGNIILACSTKSLNGKEQANVLKSLGCTIGCNLDGGASTNLYVDKSYIVKNGITGPRTVTDAIVVIPKKDTSLKETTSNFTMRLHSGSTDILDREVSGNKKVTVPVRGKIDIIGLYGWKAGDGYRWAWGKRYGIEGAFKYDPRIMIIEGKPVGNYKMKLFGSAATLRNQPAVKKPGEPVVPKGSEIKIIEFLKSVQSDGYQWCYGTHNGKYGYFQYDPAVMYPTND